MTDIWVIKTDSTGNMQWDTTFGYERNDYCWGMCSTNDGGNIFAIVKDYNYYGGTRDDFFIVKSDSEGNTESKLLLEQEGKQQARSITRTNNGGFIIAAMTESFGNANSDGILLKVSSFDNNRPDKPEIDGPTSGKPDNEYTFTATGTDPDGDTISAYMWDWGDGNFSEWLETNEATYTWTSEDKFDVKVMTMDENGGESDWSDPFEFSTPKNSRQNIIYQLINIIIEKLTMLKILS
jgi:hypothetical protein